MTESPLPPSAESPVPASVDYNVLPPVQPSRSRPWLPVVSAAAVLVVVAAALFLAVVTGCASGPSTTAPPDTPVGHQLAWVIGEINGSYGSLAEAAVTRHLAPTLRDALPSAQFVQVARQATSAYAPVRFTGFASQPSVTSAIALVETRTHDKLAIYLSLDARSPHRIKARRQPTPDGRRFDHGHSRSLHRHL